MENQEIFEQFKKDGFAAELKTLKDFEDDYGLPPVGDDDDDDEDDEEGEFESGSEGDESE